MVENTLEDGPHDHVQDPKFKIEHTFLPFLSEAGTALRGGGLSSIYPPARASRLYSGGVSSVIRRRRKIRKTGGRPPRRRQAIWRASIRRPRGGLRVKSPWLEYSGPIAAADRGLRGHFGRRAVIGDYATSRGAILSRGNDAARRRRSRATSHRHRRPVRSATSPSRPSPTAARSRAGPTGASRRGGGG